MQYVYFSYAAVLPYNCSYASNQNLEFQMTISKLYAVKDGGDLSPLDCEKINLSLAETSISDIPQEQITNVTDYLVVALNNNSVDHSLVSKLETLLETLQSTVEQG